MCNNLWYYLGLGLAIAAGALLFIPLLLLLAKRATDAGGKVQSGEGIKPSPQVRSRTLRYVVRIAQFIAKLPWPG